MIQRPANPIKISFAIIVFIALCGPWRAIASDPVLLGKWPEYKRTTPFVVAVSGNYVYLAENDFQVFDVTDPTQPKLCG